MFSLIITIISIALVAALALATLYYGGSSLTRGGSDARAAQVIVHGQQILGATELFLTEQGRYPDDEQELVALGYLRSIPTAAANSVSDAHAQAVGWVMPVYRQPVFVLPLPDVEACRGVNEKSYGARGILADLRVGVRTQCIGASTESLLTVVARNSASLQAAVTAPGSPLASETLVSAAPPSDPESPAWLVRPGADSLTSIPNWGAGQPGAGEPDPVDPSEETPGPATPAMQLTSSTLPGVTQNAALNSVSLADGLTFTNVSNPVLSAVQWTVLSGNLPTGVTLSNSGLLSGTPSVAGSYAFTAQASYMDMTATGVFELVVEAEIPVLALANISLPPASQGQNYTGFDFKTLLNITGVRNPNPALATWTLSAGSLPAGMALGASGVLSGTPTVSGEYSFTLTVTYQGVSVAREYVLSTGVSFSPIGFNRTKFGSNLGNGWPQSLAEANASLNADGNVMTIGARPPAGASASLLLFSNAFKQGGRRYVEVEMSSAQSWLMIQPNSHGFLDMSAVTGFHLGATNCYVDGVETAQCVPNGGVGNKRLGVMIDYDARVVTFYREGQQLMQAPVQFTSSLNLRLVDGAAGGAATRTIQIFPIPAQWLHAPANVLPMDKW